jgi:DNA-binding transcriptional MerR regulator
MNSENTTSPQSHPIQVASRRSGLSPDVIRVWERRYQAVAPVRTPTNRRLYTDVDVERLFLLGQVTRAGRRIGDVARLPLDELRSMVSSDRKAAVRVEQPSARSHLANCLAAVERLDAAALEKAVGDASIALAIPALMQQLLFPLLETVGIRWREGSLRVGHEHMTTAIVRSFLGATKDAGSSAEAGPELVVATPVGQRHELGALMVAVIASSDGWRTTYLGADLPALEIAAVALPTEHRASGRRLASPGGAASPTLGAGR